MKNKNKKLVEESTGRCEGRWRFCVEGEKKLEEEQHHRHAAQRRLGVYECRTAIFRAFVCKRGESRRGKLKTGVNMHEAGRRWQNGKGSPK